MGDITEIHIDLSSEKAEAVIKYKNKEFNNRTRKLMDDLQDIAERWVRKEAPRDKGVLKSATRHDGQGDTRHIFVSTTVAPYFRPVVEGHRTLTTVKQRKWWFWHLRNNLGGNYTRKTKGPKGQVPPNDYMNKAFHNMMPNIKAKVKNFMKWLVS